MKKLILFLTVLCTLAALVACSDAEVTTPVPEATESAPEATAPAHEQVEEAQPEQPEADNSASQSDSQGFLNRDVYYSIEDYEEKFGSKEETEDAVKSNSRLVLYHKEKFEFLKYDARPETGKFCYDFDIVGEIIADSKKDSFCDVTYDPRGKWEKFEASMLSNSEEIKLDSLYIDKVYYRQKKGKSFATYLIYINEEPVVVRFFHTDKEDALKILEGCEFVAPEEITK